VSTNDKYDWCGARMNILLQNLTEFELPFEGVDTSMYDWNSMIIDFWAYNISSSSNFDNKTN